jgi:hypothetical protein
MFIIFSALMHICITRNVLIYTDDFAAGLEWKFRVGKGSVALGFSASMKGLSSAANL